MATLFSCSIILVLSLGLSESASPFQIRSLAEMDRLVTCNYQPLTGDFSGEGLWQSGNTMESLANVELYFNNTRWLSNIEISFERTPIIVDHCFDDHQWWLLAWLRIYELTKNYDHVERAAQNFDYVVQNAWIPFEAQCGGGVIW